MLYPSTFWKVVCCILIHTQRVVGHWQCCPEKCGCPIPGGAQDRVGWDPKQPELVGTTSTQQRLELGNFKGPFQLKPLWFCEIYSVKIKLMTYAQKLRWHIWLKAAFHISLGGHARFFTIIQLKSMSSLFSNNQLASNCVTLFLRWILPLM